MYIFFFYHSSSGLARNGMFNGTIYYINCKYLVRKKMLIYKIAPSLLHYMFHFGFACFCFVLFAFYFCIFTFAIHLTWNTVFNIAGWCLKVYDQIDKIILPSWNLRFRPKLCFIIRGYEKVAIAKSPKKLAITNNKLPTLFFGTHICDYLKSTMWPKNLEFDCFDYNVKYKTPHENDLNTRL